MASKPVSKAAPKATKPTADSVLIDAQVHDLNQHLPLIVEKVTPVKGKEHVFVLTGTIGNLKDTIKAVVRSKNGNVPKKGQEWILTATSLERVLDEDENLTSVLVEPLSGVTTI
ncbi:hypothetical protein KW797_02940 [Candidatus Parcubacteria bacterium]|nr:hypothetical protein [Candidatus Parcubacteria bacterium]